MAADPSQIFPICVQYMSGSTNPYVRQMAIVLFRRKGFALHGPEDNKSTLWDLADPATQESIKAALVAALQTETERGVRRRIVDAICDIANIMQGEFFFWMI